MSHTFYSVTILKHVQKEAFSNQTARTAQHFKTIFLPSCPPTPTHTHTHFSATFSANTGTSMQAALFKETKFHLASQTRSHGIVLSDLWLRTDILFSSLIWFKVASFQGSGSRGVTVWEGCALSCLCQNASLLHGNKTTLQKTPFFLKSLSLKRTVALHSHHLEMKGEIWLFSSKHGFDLSDNLPGMLVHLTPLAMPPFSVAWLNFR